MSDLLPCPFCGSPFNLGCSRHWGAVSDPDSARFWRQFYTEAEKDERGAISAGNTRADLPRPQDTERITKLEAENAHLRATISALIKNSEAHLAATKVELGQIKISINQAERSVACLNDINERSQKRISDLETKNELLLEYYRAGEAIAAIKHEWQSRKANGELLDGPNIFNLTDKLTAAEARLYASRAAIASALGDVK